MTTVVEDRAELVQFVTFDMTLVFECGSLRRDYRSPMASLIRGMRRSTSVRPSAAASRTGGTRLSPPPNSPVSPSLDKADHGQRLLQEREPLRVGILTIAIDDF